MVKPVEPWETNRTVRGYIMIQDALRMALDEIDRLRQRVDALERERHDDLTPAVDFSDLPF